MPDAGNPGDEPPEPTHATARSAALPFTLRRSHDVVSFSTVTTTTESIHGLLRLHGDHLVIQWRLARRTDRVGVEIRTDEELEAVRQVIVPLAGLAGATVRRRWWRGHRLVLTAADLRAFEAVAGEAGLRLRHPAELVVDLRRGDRLAAEEFAAELALALAERSLAAPDRRRQIGVGGGAAPGGDLAAGEGGSRAGSDPGPDG